MKEENLIFIISQPRAGSTMLQKLISNNDAVATSSEPWLLFPFALFERPDLIEAKYNSDVAYRGYSDFIEKNNLNSFLEEQLKSTILSIYGKAKGDHKYFLDKTPRYYEILPQIYRWFPEAKFFVLKRNPFAVLSSMIHTWSNGRINLEILKSFKRDYLEAPGLIQSFLDEYGENSNVYEIFYESLLATPQETTKKMYEWLEIEYVDNHLNFTDNKKTEGIFGDEVYEIKRDEDYKHIPTIRSKDKWKNGLKNKELKNFMNGYNRYLGHDFISKYGYDSLNLEYTKNEYEEFFNLNIHSNKSDQSEMPLGLWGRVMRKLRLVERTYD